MNDFLPKDYEVPTSEGGYMKFKQGENRFRIMSSPILGYEYWIDTDDGKRKPVRSRMEEEIDVRKVPEPDKVKHFWAMVVWNGTRFQILEITQKSIQKSIRALSKSEDWGSPKGTDGYDILITREGERLETEYTVNPAPKKKLDKEVIKAYKDADIKLEALYEGKDPFEKEEEEFDGPEDVKKVLDK